MSATLLPGKASVVNSYLVFCGPGICVQVSSVLGLYDCLVVFAGCFERMDGQGTPRGTHHTTSEVTHTDFFQYFPVLPRFFFLMVFSFHLYVCHGVISKSGSDTRTKCVFEITNNLIRVVFKKFPDQIFPSTKIHSLRQMFSWRKCGKRCCLALTSA